MYRRVVFVGLGGSGGKTLRFIKRDLRHWLTEHNWPESRDIPSGFQFLHIDTPTIADGGEMTGAEMLPSKEYLGLVGSGVNYPQVVTQLDGTLGIKEEFSSWRVPPPLNVDITTGAGQYRAVGRTIAIAYMSQIKSGLSALLNRATSPESISDLTELWNLVNGENPDVKSVDPIVVVVTSLAGGTGAGLLMDVFDIIRSIQPVWGDESFGILYTPDVFASIGGSLVDGVQPNSLAAISEVMNGCFWHGVQAGHEVTPNATEIGLKVPKTFQAAGLTGAIARSGPAYPFLVGSKNAANVHFASDKQVFETIGSALVAWCVDPVVQGELVAYTKSNWDSRASINVGTNDVLINRGLPTEQGMPAFNALGCARVSVGTRYLERYSAQRIARDALTYIAGYHMNSDEAKSFASRLNTNKPDEIANAIAEEKLLWFLHEIKLNERGPDANDVKDALRPAEWEAIQSAAIGTATELSQLQGKQVAQAHLGAIIPAVQTATDDLDRAARPLIERNVKGWTESTPLKVISTVEVAISNFGFAVTNKLLELTINYLLHPTDGVCAELMGESEHKNYLRWSEQGSWSAQASAIFTSVKGKFSSSDASVLQAISESINYSKYIVEAQICEYAYALLQEFATGFLEPLKRSLADASVALEKEIDNVTGWPTWTDGFPPPDATPPMSEFTLIEPAKFGEVFVEMLARTVGGDPLEKLLHRSTARSSVISGDFLRDMEAFANVNKEVRPVQAIQISQSWQPSSIVVRDSVRPKANVVVSLKFSASDLQQRARMWLRRPNTAFFDLLSSTLRTYTAGDAVFSANNFVDESEYKTRRTKFAAALDKAIQASAPLVSLDDALQQQFHPKRAYRTVCSSFPFGGHELGGVVIKKMRAFIKDAENMTDEVIEKKYLVTDPKVENIQIMSVLEGAHHPFLFKSLLDPISQRWAQVKVSPSLRGLFWSKRRARVLGEFIPAPQEHIIAFIRGWFTGRLLGLIEVPRNRQDSDKETFKIAQPWSLEKGVASFPSPLLTTPAGHAGDELFAVLESLSLAFVAVGERNDLTPLRAYIVLRDMGSMLVDERILVYDSANPLIKSWILNGEITAEFGGKSKSESVLRAGLVCKMNEKLVAVSSSDHDPETRKQVLLDLLNEVISSYSNDGIEYWDKATLNKAALNNPPFWPGIRNTSEVPDLVLRSLQSLISGIERFETKIATGV